MFLTKPLHYRFVDLPYDFSIVGVDRQNFAHRQLVGKFINIVDRLDLDRALVRATRESDSIDVQAQ